jgi:Holliday junction resolvasome RuvABC endonuclease subunit
MFLGIDPSLTGTGLVLIDDSYKIIEKMELNVESKGIERLYFLQEEFLNFVNKYEKDIKLICIESPAFGVHEGQLHSLGQWSGIFELLLYTKGLSVIHCSPTQTKKYCFGSGKGQKSLILLKVFQNFNEEFSSDNLADGYIISRISRDYFGTFTENKKLDLKKYQIDVLNKIHESYCKKELI